MKFFAPFQLSENISETPEGFLACKCVAIGRVGEMTYGVGECPIPPGPDGLVIVTRSQEELFRAETIASFEGKSVTILHPEDFVHPENWSALSKGVVQNVRRGEGSQGNDLVADLLITDSQAIALVKAGLREVSCGYEAEYTQTGVGRGVQTKIIGNHLALVREGRAGSSYAINDHKGKGSMTLTEKIKAVFAKAQDEALTLTKDVNTEVPERKEGFVTIKDMQSYCDEKLAGMMKKDEPAKDEGGKQDPESGTPAKPVAKDADPVMEILQKILAKLEGGTATDEDVEEGEESEDDDFEEGTMAGETGDSAGDEDEEDLESRAEILAPGIKPGKGLKVRALRMAFATADGKAAISGFLGGKEPNWKDEKKLDVMFFGASEVLKNTRRSELSEARKRTRDSFLSSTETPKGAKSAEELNEINAKHYGKK